MYFGLKKSLLIDSMKIMFESNHDYDAHNSQAVLQ